MVCILNRKNGLKTFFPDFHKLIINFERKFYKNCSDFSQPSRLKHLLILCLIFQATPADKISTIRMITDRTTTSGSVFPSAGSAVVE